MKLYEKHVNKLELIGLNEQQYSKIITRLPDGYSKKIEQKYSLSRQNVSHIKTLYVWNEMIVRELIEMVLSSDEELYNIFELKAKPTKKVTIKTEGDYESI